MIASSELIHRAAGERDAYSAALAYEALGFSVLPCRGKQPALQSWKQLQTYSATLRTITLWEQSGLIENVGLICGRVSNNLVVIDCDGPEAVAAYVERFRPVLIDTYRVQSGSGQGAHFYYFVDDLPPTTRLMDAPFGGNVELRANGCYVVAPPSIHPNTGLPYTVVSDAPIKCVPHLRGVVGWIKEMMREKNGGELPAPVGKYTPPTNASAYGRAALAGECAAVRMAPSGSRNNTLYRAALKLGSLVRDGRIDGGTVERNLLAAASALVASDGEERVRKTILSGLTIGEQNSRDDHKRA